MQRETQKQQERFLFFSYSYSVLFEESLQYTSSFRKRYFLQINTPQVKFKYTRVRVSCSTYDTSTGTNKL